MSSLPFATLVKAILPPASAEGTTTRVTITTVEAISVRTKGLLELGGAADPFTAQSSAKASLRIPQTGADG
jgi:hypothetical protein